MNWLIDTSVLMQTIHVASSQHSVAIDALAKLRLDSDTLFVVPQNLIEFWAVATRPVSANGLGLSTEEAESEIANIKLHFILKTENETIFENWEKLAKTYRVSGKRRTTQESSPLCKLTK